MSVSQHLHNDVRITQHAHNISSEHKVQLVLH